MGARSAFFGVTVVAVSWFAAFVIEHATRMMFGVYAQFGADLPSWTLLVRDFVRYYLFWGVAAVSTVVLFCLWRRKSAYYLHACATTAVTVAFLISLSALGWVMPFMKCGFQWFPEWSFSAPTAGAGGDATAAADGSKACG